MLVNNIILQNTNNEKNILYSYTDNKDFIKLLNKAYGQEHVALLDDSAFSHRAINLIICNNKIEILDVCVQLAYYFHVPLLIIDHKVKPANMQIDKHEDILITHRNVAINKMIAQSWGNKTHEVIGTDYTDTEDILKWTNLIDTIIKEPFKVILPDRPESL